MNQYNKNHSHRQTTVPSEASSVRSQISIKSYLTVSPKQRSQIIRSSFKVFQEMQEEIILNQQCRLSLRFEQIHLLMGAQKLFLLLQKMQALQLKKLKSDSFQSISRLGLQEYSTISAFKTPQRSHSPGIVSKDIGMEKNIQNQQLIKIIQELQTTIAGKELFNIVTLSQQKQQKNGFQQILRVSKYSEYMNKLKNLLYLSLKRNTLFILKERQKKIKRIELGLKQIEIKIQKIKTCYIFQLYFELKVYQLKQQMISKSQIQIQLNGVNLKSHQAILQIHQWLVKYYYRYCFNLMKKSQFEQNMRNSIPIGRFSLGQISQTMSQQVSQVFDSQTNEDVRLQEETPKYQTSKLKTEMKSQGKIKSSVKNYLNKYEEQQLQIQQQKLEQIARSQRKQLSIKKEEKNISKLNKTFVLLLFLLAIVFVILSYIFYLQ